MPKAVRILLTLVIILVVVFLLLYPKLEWLHSEPAPMQALGGTQGGGMRAITVTGVIVHPKRLVNKITMTGEILPNEWLELRSEISGKVDRIYFKEGTFAKKGTLLVQINIDELKAQRVKLNYNKQLYRQIEFRQRQLLEREAISQEEYDIALTQLNTSLADIELLETQIGKAEIRAPFDGIVGIRSISEGAYITPSNSISNFYSINPAKIEFAISEKYVRQVHTNSEVNFYIESVATPFIGTVYAIEPSIDPETRTLRIRAVSGNSDGLLLPGQFARIELILETKQNAIMVPTEAVVPELEGTKIYLKKGGVVHQVWVETGVRTETELEILSGLNPLDTVITSGILQIRVGMPVNVNLGPEVTSM